MNYILLTFSALFSMVGAGAFYETGEAIPLSFGLVFLSVFGILIWGLYNGK